MRLKYSLKIVSMFCVLLVICVLVVRFTYPKVPKPVFEGSYSSKVWKLQKETGIHSALRDKRPFGYERLWSGKNTRGSYRAEPSLPLETSKAVFKEKLVHFDLKGAPPTVQYIQQLFPFLKEAGATGVLLEYEDMFPYEGKLRKVRSGYAYSKEDVGEILKAAHSHQLEVVPLVQTFGHMEWVLKHEEFADLREVHRYPQVLCPSNPKSLEIVKLIVDQVMLLHPNIHAFHIGADEAYYVGTECRKCREEVGKVGKDRLMLKHVASTARYLQERHKVSRVLMWHDMFDSTNHSILSEFAMGELVEPVVWGYQEDLLGEEHFPAGMFERFGKVFPKIWAGSAFKGANGPSQSFIDIAHYMKNHLSWLQVVNWVQQVGGSAFAGIILTGWQRFDHFGSLCELLPVGLPSLVLNLQLIEAGRYSPNIWNTSNRILSCTRHFYTDAEEVVLGSLGLGCHFPGGNIFDLVEELHYVRQAYEKLENSSMIKGWLSPYNLKHRYGSIFFAERVFNRSQDIIRNLTLVGQELKEKLNFYYFQDTVYEFLFANIQVFIDKLKEISRGAAEISRTEYFKSRPLEKDRLEF